MADIPDPEWLQRHKELYDEDGRPKWKEPADAQYRAMKRDAETEQTIEWLLADVTRFEFYYARKLTLPRWLPTLPRWPWSDQ